MIRNTALFFEIIMVQSDEILYVSLSKPTLNICCSNVNLLLTALTIKCLYKMGFFSSDVFSKL